MVDLDNLSKWELCYPEQTNVPPGNKWLSSDSINAKFSMLHPVIAKGNTVNQVHWKNYTQLEITFNLAIKIIKQQIHYAAIRKVKKLFSSFSLQLQQCNVFPRSKCVSDSTCAYPGTSPQFTDDKKLIFLLTTFISWQ